MWRVELKNGGNYVVGRMRTYYFESHSFFYINLVYKHSKCIFSESTKNNIQISIQINSDEKQNKKIGPKDILERFAPNVSRIKTVHPHIADNPRWHRTAPVSDKNIVYKILNIYPCHVCCMRMCFCSGSSMNSPEFAFYANSRKKDPVSIQNVKEPSGSGWKS